MKEFEVGDKVIYDDKKAEVFGVRGKHSEPGKRYAIVYDTRYGKVDKIIDGESLKSTEIEIGDLVGYSKGVIGMVVGILPEMKIVVYNINYNESIDNEDLKAKRIEELELIEKGGK